MFHDLFLNFVLTTLLKCQFKKNIYIHVKYNIIFNTQMSMILFVNDALMQLKEILNNCYWLLFLC